MNVSINNNNATNCTYQLQSVATVFRVAPPPEVIMNQATPQPPRFSKSSFHRLARSEGLSVTEEAILFAVFKTYSVEEIAVIFGIEWPVK